jgi:hypothetical protein
VGSKVVCRQDKLLHIPMWATPEHLWLQLPGFRFLPFPRTRLGIRLSVWLRSLVLGRSMFAALVRKLPLWRNWAYYQVWPDIEPGHPPNGKKEATSKLLSRFHNNYPPSTARRRSRKL